MFEAPYRHRLKIGETYVWPTVPYFTQTQSCLRLTLTDDGWWGPSYRDHPMPINLGDYENQLAAHQCYRVQTVVIEATKRTPVEKLANGRPIVDHGDTKWKTRSVRHEGKVCDCAWDWFNNDDGSDGYANTYEECDCPIEVFYTKELHSPYLEKGGKITVEELVPVEFSIDLDKG